MSAACWKNCARSRWMRSRWTISTRPILPLASAARTQRLIRRRDTIFGAEGDSAMTDNVESLLLEHLKQFPAGLVRIERKQDEAVTRLGRQIGRASCRERVCQSV